MDRDILALLTGNWQEALASTAALMKHVMAHKADMDTETYELIGEQLLVAANAMNELGCMVVGCQDLGICADGADRLCARHFEQGKQRDADRLAFDMPQPPARDYWE